MTMGYHYSSVRFHSSGSTPKHTIWAFFIYSQICAIFVFEMWEKNENKQKETGFSPFKKTLLQLSQSNDLWQS